MKKKILSIIICTAMLSAAAVPCFADSVVSSSDTLVSAAALESVITAVKSKITIPEDLKKFTSSSNDDTVSRYYTLTWTSEDGGRSLSVSTDDKGNITNYVNRCDDNDNYSALFTKEEAFVEALAFLNQIAPERAAELEYNAVLSSGYVSNGYSIYFDRMHDGVKVNRNSASVSVLKNDTGEFFIRSANISWDDTADFESAGNMISSEEIKSDFAEKYPMQLHYRKPFGMFSSKYEQPVILEYYIPDGIGYLNAQTGDIVIESTDIPRNESLSAGGSSGSSSDMNTESEKQALTPEELEEISNIANLISAEELEKNLKSITEFAIPNEAVLSSNSTYKTKDGDYQRRITLDFEDEDYSSSYSATYNAQSGELLSYNAPYRYSDSNDEKLSLDQYNAVKNTLDAFLGKINSEKLSQCAEIDYSEYQDYMYRIYADATRLVNGVPYDNNSISAAINKNGVVTRYNVTWDKDVSSFPKASEAISADQAYSTLTAAYAPELAYVKSNGKYILCYTIPAPSVYVDYKGEIIDYSGKPYAVDRIIGNYNDISGHWAQATIDLLADYNIGFTGGQFIPDAAITQADFLSFAAGACISQSYAYMSDEELYKFLIASGTLTEDEKNPSGQITREDAVTYILRLNDMNRVAELQGIYTCDFADENEISPDKYGYCALAKGFGIITGSDGYFQPKKTTTRAEAAVMLLNTITKLTR